MNSPPRSVALHLGAHKTATTHLQSVFDLSGNALFDAGVGFVGPHDLRGAGKTLFDRFPGAASPGRGASSRPAAEELAALSGGAERLVISEENYLGPTFPKGSHAGTPLYAQAEGRVSRLVRLFDPVPVTLFLAIRDPATFLVSVYGQGLMGGKIASFKEFLGKIEPIDLSWLELLSRLANVGGLNGIVVWRFEDYQALQPRVTDRMLGSPISHKLTKVPRRPNEGLSAAAVKETLQRAAAGESGSLATKARNAFPVSERHPAHAPFAVADLEASARIYDLEVGEISKLPNVELLRAETA